MMVLILFVGMLAVLSVAAARNLTPDTHRQVSRHGDFRF